MEQMREALDALLAAIRSSEEYKNYQELSGEAFYQAWIDSGGTLTLPGAEPVRAFKTR